MDLDMIREYRELSLFLLKTLQTSLAGDQGASRVMGSLFDSLQGAGSAVQIKHIHKQVKSQLLKEEPLDGSLLLKKMEGLKSDLLTQSRVENDLRQLLDDFKALVKMALHQIEILSLHDQTSSELFVQCREELMDVSDPPAMQRYIAKFKRLFSLNILIDDETGRERDELKKIISILAESISGLLKNSGDFDSGLEECISRIKKARNLREVMEVRELLLQETQKLQLRARRMVDDMRLAREQVDDANLKVENLKKQMEKVKQEIVIDPLTRAYNRRAYDEKLKHEVMSYKRYGRPTSMLLLDIDHFKQVNDTYGHRTGDGVLRILCELMSKEIREIDVLARYGGEEFALILPHTPYESALEVAERIRRKVQASRFTFKGKPFAVTISLGVGSLREGDTLESYVEKVDQALYRAKNRGRNQVAGADEPV
ncbi:MAG TPA: GGDEF domain-containing protein [Proteobacteria bacterium]|mgnify:CR=1 FL=1|nr:GGDEF domain-containing protein [Pseudomonadota bacterium]